MLHYVEPLKLSQGAKQQCQVSHGGRLVFTHTEIGQAFGGRGLGGVLAAGALDAVRAEGARAVPLCPFVAAYIDKHPAYADLVDHELLARFDAT